jgi:hypothetical protein
VVGTLTSGNVAIFPTVRTWSVCLASFRRDERLEPAPPPPDSVQ